MSVGVWSLLAAAGRQAYSEDVRRLGLDINLKDSLKIPLWLLADDAAVDPAAWFWNFWILTLDDADTLINEVIANHGPVNGNSPQHRASWYRTDEPQTGASTTTAPAGGWTNGVILLDPFRHPDAFKVDDNAPDFQSP